MTPLSGTVFVIEDVKLRNNEWIEAMVACKETCEERHWIDGQSVIFEKFDDAVAFRLTFNTGPIKEMVVEIKESP